MSRSESNIVYLIVDMTITKWPFEIAMSQIKHLKEVAKPRAWYVDIVHAITDFGRAADLQTALKAELEAMHPWQRYGGDTIVVHLNIKGHEPFRADKAMKAKISAARTMHRAQNVVNKDENGKPLPIEY